VIYIMKEIKCAFCKGKGVDPFELLSSISTCAVCGGKGKVNVEEPYIKCAFCQGTGIYPHSRLNCTVCSGKGVVTFREPKVTCPECKGTGQEHLTNLPCLKCGGIGVIKKSPGTMGEEKISRSHAGKKAAPKSTTEAAEVNNPSSAEAEMKIVEESKDFPREGEQIAEEVGASTKKAEKLVENLE
jgi:DnaJ-class molecular chaperone